MNGLNMNPEEDAGDLVDILPSFDFFNRYYMNVPVEDDENRPGLPSYDDIDRPAHQRPSLGTFESSLDVHSYSTDNMGNGVMNVGIDNLHKLPEVAAPLTIEIYTTSNVPKFGEKSERSHLLKEYTCGDIIHGVVSVCNNSDKPLKFEMFYVMLEGTVVVIDRLQQTRSVRNLVRMADMSASYAGFHVDSSVPVNQRCGEYDAIDRTILGFPHTKTLQPQQCYKKFFSFKIPDTLLESQCPHGISAHSALPPSLGIDKHRKSFACRDLKMNHQLGYARSQIRGEPVWANDLAYDSTSVEYSINATMIGKNQKTKELLNMKKARYAVRIIPTTFESISRQRMDCYGELESLIRETEGSFYKLELARKKFDQKGWVTNQDLGLDVISLKERQLRHHSKSFDSRLEQGSYTLESELVYRVQPKWISKFTKNSRQMAGVIIGKVQTPSAALPYRPAPLIAKKNSFHTKTKYEKENIARLSKASGNVLRHLEIDLRCIPANNSDAEPPNVVKVSAELISITGMSKRAIPLRLSNSTLLDNQKRISIINKFKNFEECLQEFKHWFTHNTNHIEPSWDQMVSKSLLADIQGMANLDISVAHIPIHVNQVSPPTWNSPTQGRIVINLEYPTKDVGPVIPPSFANCMCFRFYTVHLKIKFDHGVGVLQIDVPIDVRNIVSLSD